MVLKLVTIGLPRPTAEEMIHRLASEGRIYWDIDFKRKLDVREFSMRQVILRADRSIRARPRTNTAIGGAGSNVELQAGLSELL